MTNWIPLPPTKEWTPAERASFRRHVRGITQGEPAHHVKIRNPSVRAAVLLVTDLANQGWHIDLQPRQTLRVALPDVEPDSEEEKRRVRRQELLKSQEQLAEPSVRKFIRQMESPSEYRGSLVSVYSLMRDGSDLVRHLSRSVDEGTPLASVIAPYVEFVSPKARCQYTGLRLQDIWRYFRHTWANQYVSTPGRSIQLLVRDAAAPMHPIIGIASVGSAIVQIAERDRYIGWQPNDVLTSIDRSEFSKWAKWARSKLEKWFTETYIDDLVATNHFRFEDWTTPTAKAIEKLRKEATSRRNRHQRFARKADFSGSGTEDSTWLIRTKTDLFRSKRCEFLADLLETKGALRSLLYPIASKNKLRDGLQEARVRKAILWIARRAKAETVGTEIADITVCGAIAPYNHLIAGKLVSAIVTSPAVVRGYAERYRHQKSEIASSMAGRSITRRSSLVYLGTTSLYGASSSQYNRIKIPASVVHGAVDIRFHELGRSKSYGTSHFSRSTTTLLAQLAEQSANGIRVNSIFGEGVSPKLRKVRDGIEYLGWPSEELLRHGRSRLVYGVPLIDNLRDYLLGIDTKPSYIYDVSMGDDIERISEWWRERWLRNRIARNEVLEAVSQHRLVRPIQHGARVVLPEIEFAEEA